jgi:hypothetical protein
MARACFSSRVELDQSVDGLLFVQAGKKKKEKVKMKRETLPTRTGGEEHEFVVNVRRKEGKGRVQGGARIKRGSVVSSGWQAPLVKDCLESPRPTPRARARGSSDPSLPSASATLCRPMGIRRPEKAW